MGGHSLRFEREEDEDEVFFWCQSGVVSAICVRGDCCTAPNDMRVHDVVSSSLRHSVSSFTHGARERNAPHHSFDVRVSRAKPQTIEHVTSHPTWAARRFVNNHHSADYWASLL